MTAGLSRLCLEWCSIVVVYSHNFPHYSIPPSYFSILCILPCFHLRNSKKKYIYIHIYMVPKALRVANLIITPLLTRCRQHTQSDRKVRMYKVNLLSCNRMLTKNKYVPPKDDENIVAIYYY